MPGIKDIYRMTKPLGYALGGPAGMTEPERKSAQPVTMAQIMRDAEASRGPAEVTHPIQKIISDRTIVDPYSVSQGERLKDLGSTGIETLKKLGSGAMGIGQELLGAGPAEASDKEMQKRKNYFDLKRDEFMALEEYLLSGLSERDLR